VTERRLFDVAAAVLALHLVDDGFVNHEPGTNAGDHVRTTLIPLLLIGVAALVHRRALLSVRASIAFGLGVVTLIIGVAVHVAQAFMGPFGGDHWTGLLLVPAGGAFLAAAWLARRRAPRRSRKRRALVAVAWVLALYAFIVPFGAGYVITHKPRAEAVNADLGAASIPVRLRTDDGLELAARYVPSRNRAAVLLLPGRPEHARMLIQHGYGVLLVDLRGNRESGGDANAFGWDSPRDAAAAVAYLRGRPDVDPQRIGGLGFSVGSEVLLTAAATGTPLRAVVSEGAGVRTIHEERLRTNVSALLELPFSASMLASTRLFSTSTPPEPLDRLVPRIAPRPILLIEAGHGQGGEDRNSIYFRRARAPKAYWRIAEANHTGGLETRPREYERRVVGFFDRALLRAS
jgi:dienelactone hydrolase